MNSNIKNQIEKVLSKVKHPAIDASLVELGIVKETKVKGNKIFVTMSFPFPGIPIKDDLIKTVKEALNGFGLEINITTKIMNQKELERFLSIEQKKWKI